MTEIKPMFTELNFKTRNTANLLRIFRKERERLRVLSMTYEPDIIYKMEPEEMAKFQVEKAEFERFKKYFDSIRTELATREHVERKTRK